MYIGMATCVQYVDSRKEKRKTVMCKFENYVYKEIKCYMNHIRN